jgi:hypothetical protein
METLKLELVQAMVMIAVEDWRKYYYRKHEVMVNIQVSDVFDVSSRVYF